MSTYTRHRRSSLYKRALGGLAVPSPLTASIGIATSYNNSLGLGPAVLAGQQAGFAASSNTAFALTRLQLADVGRADTFNLALAGRSVEESAVGRADTTDAALALAAIGISAVGMTTSASTALALAPVGIVTAPVGMATSSNTALALTAAVTTYGAVDDTSGRPSLVGYTLKNFVSDYGGNGNGTADNSTAINNAMAAANGTAVYFPPGTYAYSNYHQMSSKNNVLWYGAGYGSTILKPTGVNSNTAIVLWNCTNIKMVDFKLWAANTTARVDTGANCGFYIYNCPGPILIQNVYVQDTSSGAILVDHSTDVSLIRDTVWGSRSDSYHFTGASTNGLAQYCYAKNSGDDAFASIGYGAGTGQNVNTQFLDNLVEDALFASGIDFQGTTGGAAKRNRVIRSGAAGIQLSAVSSYNSGSVTGIAVEDNYLEDVVTRPELAGAHGAILLLTQTAGQHISGITLLRNTIKNARYATEAFRGNAADATRYIQAALTNNIMIRTTGPMTTAYAVNANTTLTKSGNTFNGTAAP
jgi:hypothetical protein